jgi:hypothetical protein
MHRSVVVLFWFFWILKVDCVVDQRDGDVTCYLHTRGGQEVICRQGGEESQTEKHLDLKPTMDAECMVPMVRW